MRELVLNHASLTAAGEHELVAWLDDLAKGIAMVVGAGLTQKALRMCRLPYDIDCFRDRSLHDAYLSLLKIGRTSAGERRVPAWFEYEESSSKQRLPGCCGSFLAVRGENPARRRW